MNFLFTIIFALTPFLLTTFTSELFEVPKMYFVYLVSIFILGLFIKSFKPKITIYLIVFFIFLISQTISTIFSIDRHTSFFGYYSRLNGGLLSTLVYFILALILSSVNSENLTAKIIKYSLISGFLISIYGILEHFGIDKNYWVQDVQARVFSTFGQPNWLAAYLCILIPLAIDKLISSPRLSYFVYLISYIFCLIFTKSKSGLIALAISLFVYFVLKISKKFLFTLPLIGLVFFFILKSSTTVYDPNSKLLITSSSDIRKIVWVGAINLWRNFPLIGTGPETFAYSYYWVRPAAHNLTSEWDFVYNKAHNEYLNQLATSGAFGFFTYLALIIIALITLFKSKNYALLSAYLSILITNGLGFSVVVISLFFFLIPCFVNQTPIIKPIKTPFYRYLIAIIVVLFCLFQLTTFLIADASYAAAENYDQHNNLPAAADQIQLSLKYRPQEPEYLIKAALIFAKLTVANHTNPEIATKYLEKHQQISFFNLNHLKLTAQAYYYLSAYDPKYFADAILTLTKVTKLAPTDAKSFYTLGQFYQQVKDYPQAKYYYQAALDLKPNYDQAKTSLIEISSLTLPTQR